MTKQYSKYARSKPLPIKKRIEILKQTIIDFEEAKINPIIINNYKEQLRRLEKWIIYFVITE